MTKADDGQARYSYRVKATGRIAKQYREEGEIVSLTEEQAEYENVERIPEGAADFSFPYETKALRVEQRLGTFYVAVLPAELLLQVAASDRLSAIMNPDGSGYQLEGTQRIKKDQRLNEIANYINRLDSSFPNSIILAANYDLETGFNQGEHEDILEEEKKPIEKSQIWTITESRNSCHTLTIPTDKKLAAIIDGQHRLFSFAQADPDAMRDTNLLCSIFIDLPKALQAQVFATINSTQKRVDRSLTFELFGYNVEDEEEEYWTPDKLAVFLTRKIATEDESPLKGRVVVSPKRDSTLEKLHSAADWRVSTAVIVDGIMRLFSSNPKRDANIMRQHKAHPRSELREKTTRDRSPFREAYLKGNDKLIYKMVFNYLEACEDVFWAEAKPDSFIFRTVGMQAVFDILRKLAKQAYVEKDISVTYFTKKIEAARSIDFSQDSFRKSSGAGRSFIRSTIEREIGLER